MAVHGVRKAAAVFGGPGGLPEVTQRLNSAGFRTRLKKLHNWLGGEGRGAQHRDQQL